MDIVQFLSNKLYLHPRWWQTRLLFPLRRVPVFTFQPSRGGSPALGPLIALYTDTLPSRVVDVGVVMVVVTVVTVMVQVVPVRVFMMVV